MNNRFRDSALILKPTQAILRLLKLPLEGFAICIAVRGHLLADLFGLRLQRLASSRRVACGQGRTRLFCAAQEFSLLQNSAVQPRNLRFELERILPAVPVRNDRCECCQNHCRAENKNRRNQPQAPFGIHAATQGFHSSLRQVLFLQRIFQLCFELQLWLSLTKLRPDPGCEFQRFKRKGDDVVSAQVQRAGTFQRATVNDHHNLESSRIRTCLDLADQTAAAEVGWRCFCDQDFRGKSENFINRQVAIRGDFIALT